MLGATYPIIDSHVHYPDPSYLASFVRILEQWGVYRLNAVCVPHPTRLSVVPDALHLKAHYPDRVYVYGSMDFSLFRTHPQDYGRALADYVDTLLEMGCDGVKMWEGKPEVRQRYAIPPLDGAAYDPYWARLAERQMPVLLHLNDPASFWDAERIPWWARTRGWFYGDGSYVNNETQYAEVLRVLDRHPSLRPVFAHFMFLADDLPRLAEYMERYPALCVDVTPGVEMYASFSAAPEAARDFFLRYQERILYGTDYGALAMLAAPREEISPRGTQGLLTLVQGFLEREGALPLAAEDGSPLLVLEGPVQGIGLPPHALERIYWRNFERLAGTRPRPLRAEAIVAECERLMRTLQDPTALLPGAHGDKSVALQVKSFFEMQPG